MTKDQRPENCRIRLRDEGKPYPRSRCTGCGRSVVGGLECPYPSHEAEQPRPDDLYFALVKTLKDAELLEPNGWWRDYTIKFSAMKGEGDTVIITNIGIAKE